jgi:hypothetical protein
MTFALPKFDTSRFTAPKFSAPTMRDAVSCWTMGNWMVVTVWLLSGILAIYIPHHKWEAARDDYYTATGYAIEAEQAQRAYEEAQRDQNNQGYYYPSDNCAWYQYSCRKAAYLYRQNNENQNEQNGNNNAEDTPTIPLWYIFLGGETEEGRRDREESGLATDSTGALDAVYTWTLLLFFLILAYGAYALFRFRQNGTASLMVTLLLLFQFSLMTMILLAQGVIQTEDRQMEDSVYGWYGQKGVLLVYTYYALCWFSGFFTLGLSCLNLGLWWTRRREQQAAKRVEDESLADSYVAIETPKIEITDPI